MILLSANGLRFLQLRGYNSPPLSTGDMVQDHSGCLKPQIVPNLIYTMFYTDIPMTKFNVEIKYSKRLIKIATNHRTNKIIYCNKSYVKVVLSLSTVTLIFFNSNLFHPSV